MLEPLSAPCLIALHRAIADGSLSGAAVQAMAIGPAPVSASGRRQTRELSDIPLTSQPVLDTTPT